MKSEDVKTLGWLALVICLATLVSTVPDTDRTAQAPTAEVVSSGS